MVTFISGVKLKTRKYSKPTDRHLYLHHISDHPVAVKNAIPYGLAVTTKRICSEAEEYNKQKECIKERLIKGGYYPQDCILTRFHDIFT